MIISTIVKRIKAYSPMANVKPVIKAYVYANAFHKGQLRHSGEPFVSHPLEVALILAELELDIVTITAGLLHDTLEDTGLTAERLIEEFGEEVYELVEGVTKLNKIMFQSKEELQAENLRKMFLAMARDVRVVMIRLADRLHNMRTLLPMPLETQCEMSQETLEIYAPLAHRLGVWRLKWELEDLAFQFLEPDEYDGLKLRVAKQRTDREAYIEEVKEILISKLDELEIKAEITGRPKHFYSIYQKMKKQGKEFEEILDLVGVRVIVQSIRDCYGVLGLVHTLWKPIPGRFKDYIAVPKSNMYQSLHTTVIGPKGEPLEVQVRTEDMHRTSEFGIAAHWKYKEGIHNDEEFEDKIAWLRQLLEWQKDMKDVRDFMETLRIDLFEDEVFVFTPKGDVKNLPSEATPVDFAYSVHTHIGHSCVGAKINGKIVPLNYILKNGDIVEILTSKIGANPSRDWLGFVKTSKARNRIRQWIKEQRKEESISAGKEALEKELRKQNLAIHSSMEASKLQETAEKFGFTESEDLLAAIGYGKVPAKQVVTRLFPEKPSQERRLEKLVSQTNRAIKHRQGQGVRVKGIDNLLVKFSKCCNPVPGDEIIGYVTRGRGVSIHRKDCPNVTALEGDSERHMVVEWDMANGSSYPVDIEVDAIDRFDLLADIMATISGMKTNIAAVKAHKTRNGMAIVNVTVEINDVDHMKDIMDRIKRVENVIDVFRPNPS